MSDCKDAESHELLIRRTRLSRDQSTRSKKVDKLLVTVVSIVIFITYHST